METWTHKLAVKPETGDKIEMAISANMTGLDLEPFIERGLKDFAANSAKVVRDGDSTADDFVAGFQEMVEKYSRREKTRKEGGGAVRVDTAESLAIRNLADVLKDKHTLGQIASAKNPVPRADDPPKTEKGKVNFNAWAKVLKEGEHPWYVVAKKKADAEIVRREAAKSKDFE